MVSLITTITEIKKVIIIIRITFIMKVMLVTFVTFIISITKVIDVMNVSFANYNKNQLLLQPYLHNAIIITRSTIKPNHTKIIKNGINFF